MAITLDADERRRLLEGATTGILTTLRRDGGPVALPVWFVLHGDALYTRTPRPTMKLRRVRHDPRGSFLVESGEKWLELTALHLDVAIAEESDPATLEQVHAALDDKYAGMGPPLDRLPERARALYADRAVLRLTPVGRQLSWDNAKIRLG